MKSFGASPGLLFGKKTENEAAGAGVRRQSIRYYDKTMLVYVEFTKESIDSICNQYHYYQAGHVQSNEFEMVNNGKKHDLKKEDFFCTPSRFHYGSVVSPSSGVFVGAFSNS